MQVRFRQEGETLVVAVTGRLDTGASSTFLDEVEPKVSTGYTTIVIDCSELDYISSAGLRSILVIAQKTNQAHGELSCCCLKGLVKKVFEISKFSQIVPSFDSLEDALENKSNNKQ